jgi:hypothetical protein
MVLESSSLHVTLDFTKTKILTYPFNNRLSPFSRAYFGHLPMQLWVISSDPLLDFMFPVRAKPHNGILTRTHDKQRDHLACSVVQSVKQRSA